MPSAWARAAIASIAEKSLVLISIQVLPRRSSGSASSSTAALAAGVGRQVIKQSQVAARMGTDSTQRAPAATAVSAAARLKSLTPTSKPPRLKFAARCLPKFPSPTKP